MHKNVRTGKHSQTDLKALQSSDLVNVNKVCWC